MGKKAGKKNGGGGSSAGGGGGFSTIDVDPRLVRYAHSKIKPLFSGCGRTIEQTLREIRDGRTRASDLPMITVLLGSPDPSSDGGQQRSFFSLNNRRLFVFKACQEEGLLGPSGLVRVRARPMKAHERERYTVERCSLQAKFLFELETNLTFPERARCGWDVFVAFYVDGGPGGDGGSTNHIDGRISRDGRSSGRRGRGSGVGGVGGDGDSDSSGRSRCTTRGEGRGGRRAGSGAPSLVCYNARDSELSNSPVKAALVPQSLRLPQTWQGMRRWCCCRSLALPPPLAP